MEKKFTLPEFPKKRRYSLTEHRLFDLLPQDGSKVLTSELVAGRGEGWKVQFPMRNVTVTMDVLSKKIKDNREPFRIKKEGKRRGHMECEYWLESL
jgi:hypothetical protein